MEDHRLSILDVGAITGWVILALWLEYLIINHLSARMNIYQGILLYFFYQNSTSIRNYPKLRRNQKFHSIVFNMIIAIVRSFDAKIVKNVGDGFVFYFPNTNNSADVIAFKDVIECCSTSYYQRKIV